MARRHPWLVLALAAGIAANVVLCTSCRETSRLEPIPKLADALDAPPRLRVEIGRDLAEARVQVEGRYEMHCGRTLTGPRLAPTAVKPAARGLIVGDRPIGADTLTLSTPDGRGIGVGDGRYRGSIIVRRRSSRTVSIVNVVDAEAMLYGVVTAEMPSRWPMDALKAQAVAARTFVLYRWQRRRDRDVHVTRADVRYLGLPGETARARQAVDETRGVVMTFNGRLFATYFSATCGGRTTPVDRGFGERLIAPLAGVECGHCQDATFYSWRCRMGKAELARRLGLQSDATVTAIRPDVARPYDRAARIMVETDRGSTTVEAYRFRMALGPDRLRSSAFVATPSADAFEFVGRGWGHGVGLCQWGARGLAQGHTDWRGIVSRYFPEAVVTRMY